MPTATGYRRFSVLYKGDKIGAHTASYSSGSGETHVSTEIHLSVIITPHFGGSIWYDKANLWVRGEFERDGSKV